MYIKMGSASKIYNDATIWNDPIALAAGATYQIKWEVDMARPMTKKDIALTVYASGPGITITHMADGLFKNPSGISSDGGYPF